MGECFECWLEKGVSWDLAGYNSVPYYLCENKQCSNKDKPHPSHPNPKLRKKVHRRELI